jgi:hypothetical protein
MALRYRQLLNDLVAREGNNAMFYGGCGNCNCGNGITGGVRRTARKPAARKKPAAKKRAGATKAPGRPRKKKSETLPKRRRAVY